jgi:hypothetical protein
VPRKQLAALGLAVIAAAGLATSAASFNPKELDPTFFRGPIDGVVLAVSKPDGDRARIAVSLHGVDPGTRYGVAGSAQPCSETLAGPTYRIGLGTPARSDLFATARRRTGSTRSVRIFTASPGGAPQQVACSAIDNSVPDGPVRVAGVFRRGVQGVVAGVRKGKRTHLTISLHGLEPGTAYTVVGSTRACSHGATKATTAYTIDLKNTTISSYFGEASRKARETKSVRLLQGSKQVACSVLVTDDEARLTR